MFILLTKKTYSEKRGEFIRMRKNTCIFRLQKYTFLLHQVGILSDEEREEIMKSIEHYIHLDNPFFIPKKLP